MNNFIIFYASKGFSAKNVADKVTFLLNIPLVNVINLNDLPDNFDNLENLKFNHILFVCANYGDNEMDEVMENFLIKFNWYNYIGINFSIIQLGIYDGYELSESGSAFIIKNFLTEKKLINKTKLLFLDSYKTIDYFLIEKWININFKI